MVIVTIFFSRCVKCSCNRIVKVAYRKLYTSRRFL